MGTSGNRKGYKIFSINTTIRNPKRNVEFLQAFQDFDGQIMTDDTCYAYLCELIKRGIYTYNIINDRDVKNKLENEQLLSIDEVKRLIEDNPQATGNTGRIKTQLRALKDQGFLLFNGTRGDFAIHITQLGKELLNHNKDQSVTYLKSMIGMQALSPIRKTIYNKSVPFLNTLFVINGINQAMIAQGKDAKGILMHEFAVFVLSMKDTNYQLAIDNIMEYRRLYGSTINKSYLTSFLKTNNILPLAWNTLIHDYPDEVFRKFEMTGLLYKHGFGQYLYINFSAYNKEKVESILDYYKNYQYKSFSTAKEYFDYCANVTIPWENNEILRRRIVIEKAKILNIQIDNSLPLQQQEIFLDRIFYTRALDVAVKRCNEDDLKKELKILAGTSKDKSAYSDLPESLRLEYILALAIGKRFGTQGLISNIIYNEEGEPLHTAPGNKCDIILIRQGASFILEPTMLRSKDQQMNSETTNIVRHLKDEQKKFNVVIRAMMIAPKVHPDVADFFQYKATKENFHILPYSIERSIGWIFSNITIDNLCQFYDADYAQLLQLTNDAYTTIINSYCY